MKKSNKIIKSVIIIILSLAIGISIGVCSTLVIKSSQNENVSIKEIFDNKKKNTKDTIVKTSEKKDIKLKEENVSESEINSVKVIDSDTIVGYLTIDNIGIKNEKIIDGVDENTLKHNIGHFTSTPTFNGNICLAAHNFSVENSNLFRDLYKLKVGDNVVYSSQKGNKKYKVTDVNIIKSNDFSVLNATENNCMTLITCVNGDKNVRLCVRAQEVEE